MAGLTDLLKRLRDARGSSQSEVARWSGMRQSDVSRIESGKKDPRLSTLERFATALDAEIVLVPKEKAAAVRRLAELAPSAPDDRGFDLLETFGVNEEASR